MMKKIGVVSSLAALFVFAAFGDSVMGQSASPAQAPSRQGTYALGSVTLELQQELSFECVIPGHGDRCGSIDAVIRHTETRTTGVRVSNLSISVQSRDSDGTHPISAFLPPMMNFVGNEGPVKVPLTSALRPERYEIPYGYYGAVQMLPLQAGLNKLQVELLSPSGEILETQVFELTSETRLDY
ncbi:MAG: hypothetical protein WCU88_03005 [Elusimicrobiota bacterium]|jgi:hypothetical protein